MGQRISGKNFDVNIGDMLVHVNKATLEITDNIAVAKDRGVPNGWVDGDVEASGEIELDATNLKLVTEAASAAGSFRQLDPFDLLFFATTANGEEMKVQAFGCKLKIGSLLDIDPKGGEKVYTTIAYNVTSPDFIRINGVPYLSQTDTDGLV